MPFRAFWLQGAFFAAQISSINLLIPIRIVHCQSRISFEVPLHSGNEVTTHSWVEWNKLLVPNLPLRNALRHGVILL